MQVTIEIPEAVKQAFEKGGAIDLPRAAVEALAIEGYRTGRISAGQLAEWLDLASSIEALEWLGRRGIPMNYDLQDLEDDRKAMEKLLGDRRA